MIDLQLRRPSGSIGHYTFETNPIDCVAMLSNGGVSCTTLVDNRKETLILRVFDQNISPDTKLISAVAYTPSRTLAASCIGFIDIQDTRAVESIAKETKPQFQQLGLSAVTMSALMHYCFEMYDTEIFEGETTPENIASIHSRQMVQPLYPSLVKGDYTLALDFVHEVIKTSPRYKLKSRIIQSFLGTQ